MTSSVSGNRMRVWVFTFFRSSGRLARIAFQFFLSSGRYPHLPSLIRHWMAYTSSLPRNRASEQCNLRWFVLRVNGLRDRRHFGQARRRRSRLFALRRSCWSRLAGKRLSESLILLTEPLSLLECCLEFSLDGAGIWHSVTRSVSRVQRSC